VAKNLLPIDALIADQLLAGVQDAGLTYRQIAASTGMSINRLGIILRKEPPPATVGEVGLIARCFGSSASEIILAAEAAAAQELVANVTPLRSNPVTAKDTIDHVEAPNFEELDYAAKRGKRKADAEPWAE
jgi:hypothetical protein